MNKIMNKLMLLVTVVTLSCASSIFAMELAFDKEDAGVCADLDKQNIRKFEFVLSALLPDSTNVWEKKLTREDINSVGFDVCVGVSYNPSTMKKGCAGSRCSFEGDGARSRFSSGAAMEKARDDVLKNYDLYLALRAVVLANLKRETAEHAKREAQRDLEEEQEWAEKLAKLGPESELGVFGSLDDADEDWV